MPQLEDGYLKIANELFDALIKFKLPGNELRIALFIIRKTYGFNKKSDWISNSQFVSGTGINKSNVCRCVNALILKKFVDKDDNKTRPKYRFNKNYWQWKKVTARATTLLVTYRETAVDHSDNSTFVDLADNQNQPKDCSSDQNQDQESLTLVTTRENGLLSPGSPTKDSNNVTKDRGTAKGGQEKKTAKKPDQTTLKKLRTLSIIASGKAGHSVVSEYAWSGESYDDMKARASRELENLKRNIK